MSVTAHQRIPGFSEKFQTGAACHKQPGISFIDGVINAFQNVFPFVSFVDFIKDDKGFSPAFLGSKKKERIFDIFLSGEGIVPVDDLEEIENRLNTRQLRIDLLIDRQLTNNSSTMP